MGMSASSPLRGFDGECPPCADATAADCGRPKRVAEDEGLWETPASAACSPPPGQPAFLIPATACAASGRSIRKERAEERSGATVEARNASGRPPGRDP